MEELEKLTRRLPQPEVPEIEISDVAPSSRTSSGESPSSGWKSLSQLAQIFNVNMDQQAHRIGDLSQIVDGLSQKLSEQIERGAATMELMETYMASLEEVTDRAETMVAAMIRLTQSLTNTRDMRTSEQRTSQHTADKTATTETGEDRQ